MDTMATFRDLLLQTKARIREVTTAEGEQALADPKTVVLDVREPDEYDQGALPRAIHIPRGQLESNIENKIVDHDAPVLIYCAGGTRSAFAAETLNQLGYTDVVSMAGGTPSSSRRMAHSLSYCRRTRSRRPCWA